MKVKLTHKYRTHTIEGSQTKQQLLLLPLDFVRQYTEDSLVEFKQVEKGVLALRMVDPKTPQRERRYKIVRHHGSAWVSIPRPWLRDRNAKDNDEIEVWSTLDDCNILYLVLKRQERI